MKIGILGYGKEGKSAEKYFQKHGAETQVFDNFTLDDLAKQDFSEFDLILRSPSVHPRQDWFSSTRYFFQHCPCSIIGVTGTKGKGTTCSIITALLKKLGKKTWLVGNIGNPALDALDQITPDDAVVYELSSFQLWDLEQSPHIAVVLRIEPDHLNVHDGFADYVNAKANICKHQTPNDYCIYYKQNANAAQIATAGLAHKLSYPVKETNLNNLTQHLAIPGQHNRENAEAALLAVACYYDMSIEDFAHTYRDDIIDVFNHFHSLPHRLEFIRELNGVRYYDDNFSSAFPALDVALAAFPNHPVFLIAGGQNRSIDYAPTRERIFSAPNLQKAFLIGEISHILTQDISPTHYQLCNSLAEALNSARQAAEIAAKTHPGSPAIVLMSPGAPSFDMFQNFTDRGEQFQKLVKEL